MVYVIILSVVAGVLGIYYFLFKDLDFFRKNGIPHLKPLPLVGNLGPWFLGLQSVADLMKKLYDKNHEAKYIGFYDMTRPVVMLRDIELIKSIALKNFELFPDHSVFVREDQDPFFSRNLFSLQGDRWREVRAILSPAFTSSKMKSMFKLMSDYGVQFANFMAQLPPEQRLMIDTKDVFSKYTNDVIATCAFGVSVDSMRDPKNLFYVYGRETTILDSVSSIKFYIFRNLPWLARLIRLKFIREPISKFFCDLVETTVKVRDEKGIVRPDMLQLMMESRGKKEGGEDLSIADMTSQAFSFFFGGFDSTSTLMCFAAHEIAVNEEVQKRLQNEIDQVLENTNGGAPYDAVNRMEYLDAVISETLRRYPIFAALDRVCIRDFELPPTLPGAKPFIMKEGQTVWIPVYGLQHDPKYFEEPEKFNPDRFLGEQKKHALSTGAYLPFGLGPRMCIGNRFASLKTKVLLFHLLARCDLLPCEKTLIPLVLAKDGFNMTAEGGFWLEITPRKNAHRSIAVNNANDTCEL
ncbi:PREDICTED: cytochrome P450 9e2-like [Dinoponera quadriceps]|uniref:Cytochrome P450 9e2-like n=1 Tax=Dinoponera quadriceps TaxID=609295 RepID=A0A6P3XDI6_DINQU|nr:PREDICTED: cytochrome P450 9e2-like [Dinoponera quadriceps]